MYRPLKIKYRQNYIDLVVLLLITLNCQSAIAFTIKPKTGATYYYIPTIPYPIDNNIKGTIRLNNKNASSLKPSEFKKY